jgi:hypothetical protein
MQFDRNRIFSDWTQHVICGANMLCYYSIEQVKLTIDFDQGRFRVSSGGQVKTFLALMQRDKWSTPLSKALFSSGKPRMQKEQGSEGRE